MTDNALKIDGVLSVPPLDTWTTDQQLPDRPLVEHLLPTHALVWLYLEFPNGDGFPTDGAGEIGGTSTYEVVSLLAHVVTAENGPTTLWHPLVGEIGKHYNSLDDLKREEMALLDAEMRRLDRQRQQLILDVNSLKSTRLAP